MAMFLGPALRISLIAAALASCASAQEAPPKEAQGKEASADAKGLPPRATPADYQTQAQAGSVTIAAEFVGHSVPTPQKTLSTDEYIVVETALFGPADGRLKLSIDDFTLRINGKKTATPREPLDPVMRTVKDPDWEPPSKTDSKSKTSFGGSGGRGQGDSKPAPVKIPIDVRRGMEQSVLKASLLEGERALPQAGLIFFQYRGKGTSIHSLELIYSGPAGKATLTLQP